MMANKLKAYFKKYFSGRSRFSKYLDIIFILLIIGMLIPGPRKEIMVFIKKMTLFQPRVNEEAEYRILPEEYNWTYMDMEGNSYHFSDLKGEVVFLNLWASWCPPCIAEMPSIQKLYEDYKGRVKFILLSNEDPAEVQSFLQENEFSLPAYIQSSNLPASLGASSIPKTYIISKKGEIIYSKTGSAKWHGEKVHELLDSLLEE